MRFLIAALTALGLLAQPIGPAAAQSRSVFESLDFFSWTFEQIRERYVEEVDDAALIEAAVRGMLASLDPHSVWLTASDYEAIQTQTRGSFGGLGLEVTMEQGFVKVVSPIDGTPAARAGLRAGDYITHLDGEPVQGLLLTEAVERMRGPVGSAIVLSVVREGEPPFDVSITRDRIKIRSVHHRLESGGVGYIRVTHFNAQTAPGLRTAFEALRQEADGAMAGYVLDLRNNPGGTLDAAIEVTDMLLDGGLIVSTRGRETADIRDERATPGDMAGGLPVVVLINNGSASASEIVAGALQDQQRAIIMGERSFGKGSVQRLFPMRRNGGALKLTTQRYYTPSGRSIQGHGIDPDIVVKQARVDVEDAGEEVHESDLRNALPNPQDGAADEDAIPHADTDDYQLFRALDLARGIAQYRQSVTEQ